jgi:hypothetical protein
VTETKTRTLLVDAEGRKAFRITIPANARVTFGPFSPPVGDEQKGYGLRPEKAKGTLRIYEGGKTKTTENVLAVFAGVTGFRDVDAIDYEERVATEEVRTVWKSDKKGYRQEVVAKHDTEWVDPNAPLLASGEEEEEAF